MVNDKKGRHTQRVTTRKEEARKGRMAKGDGKGQNEIQLVQERTYAETEMERLRKRAMGTGMGARRGGRRVKESYRNTDICVSAHRRMRRIICSCKQR